MGSILGCGSGDSVRFLSNGGHDWDRKEASRAGLIVGELYTIRNLIIGGWSSTVELEEAPGYQLNTVMFCPIVPPVTP